MDADEISKMHIIAPVSLEVAILCSLTQKCIFFLKLLQYVSIYIYAFGICFYPKCV